MFNKNKSQKAFTLIELLVVMAIIAILSAIMFGPIQTARRRSKDTQAVADMKLLKNYLTLWADDHNGVYPITLEPLSIYGSLPSRRNTDFDMQTTPNSLNDVSKYYYLLVGSIDCAGNGGDTNNTCSGFHLWTHLNDTNEAFNSDADCSSVYGSISISCWANGEETSYGNLEINGKSGNDSTGDGNGSNSPNASVCKDILKCILDYSNTK